MVSAVLFILADIREQQGAEENQQLHQQDRIQQPLPTGVGRIREVRSVAIRHRPQIQLRHLHDNSRSDRQSEQHHHLQPAAVMEIILINVADDENERGDVE